jgi:hypothetical protein
MPNQNSGASRIYNERARQSVEEGYLPGGDVGRSQELMRAAIGYIGHAGAQEEFGVILTVEEMGTAWPWPPESFKPEDPVRTLEKAGALIAAAIDALEAERELKAGETVAE